ncbi:S23 ribosomal protein [Galbibacter orientalis DSM 19592]|uniref:S23 ribosomal protein n=1 Tax=Galbibacter orientalis DSM 19592 TaxID=926559 RepID=I3C480_9FLAO|nr:four helix bundle protein [Galbibacter orientalis]EIJ38423.1 S23 ribosomal protein [Galbibacter orientalis DSM 19592]
MSDIKTFEDLNSWVKGTELRRKIASVIKTFPKFEKFELMSQMRRASRSVTHNIAEGYGRFHFKENAQFCRISRGSLYGILDQIITALDENYIDNKTYEDTRLMVIDCIKILNGYINYLSNAKSN